LLGRALLFPVATHFHEKLFEVERFPEAADLPFLDCRAKGGEPFLPLFQKHRDVANDLVAALMVPLGDHRVDDIVEALAKNGKLFHLRRIAETGV